MAEMEIIRIDTGERTIIEIDGTVIKDQVPPPKLEWCDLCEQYKTINSGLSFNYGYDAIWICADCRHK